MTYLFGCICNQPQRVTEALSPVRTLLVTGGPSTRYGLAYVQSGEVLLSRTPAPSAEPIDFYEEIERRPSDYLICHAYGEDGRPGTVNTQPFRFRRWMFAMEGETDGFADVAPRLLEHIPPYLRRNIKGKTQAEHVFHVFLSLLHDAGSIDDPNLDPGHTRRMLRDALALCLGAFTKAGVAPDLGNVVVSNSRSMIAARLAQPLYMRRLKVPVSPRDPETFRGVLALSTADDPGEGFEEIPGRSALAVRREILTDIASLDD